MVWQSLVRNWLSQQARQMAVDAVAGATKPASAAGTDTPEQAGPPPPADVGIVFALGIESGGLEDLLEGALTIRTAGPTFVTGGLRGRSVAIVRAGVGCQSARAGTTLLIDGHRPRLVISAGFAGGLVDSVGKGELVIVDSVVDATGKQIALHSQLDLRGQNRVHTGRLVTTDAVIADPEQKRELAVRYGAIAVDMETFAVAEACREAALPFCAVRVISDAVDDRLPPEIEQLARQKSTLGKLGAATGAIFRRPSAAKDMLNLKTDAIVASDRLAKFLADLIAKLTAQTEQAIP